MKSHSEIEHSLYAMRSIWKDGNELLKRVVGEEDCSIYSSLYGEVVGYIASVKLLLENLFFSKRFYEAYDDLIRRNCYEGNDDWLQVKSAITITLTYIRNLGSFVKNGYVKDPYSGINNDDSRIGFVAMWFDESMEGVYCNGIKVAIECLGYESVRIDKQEHNDRIDQRIFEQIRKARFLVADLTANRAGVYYEAGFAAGQGIPVIHICKDTDFDSRHFDVKTYNTIKYSGEVDLCEKLTSRIAGTIGQYKRLVQISEPSASGDSPF